MVRRMITALIRVSHGPEALALTLSALVPAVAAGLVADAVILVEARDEAIEHVAEAAGATVALAPARWWREGAQRARRDWLLCLEDCDLPQEGWIRALERSVSLAGHQRARPLQAPSRGRQRRAAGDPRPGSPSPIRPADLVCRRVLLERPRKPPRRARLAAAIERDPALN